MASAETNIIRTEGYFRIAHESYRINITSIDEELDISMREVYSLDKALRE